MAIITGDNAPNILVGTASADLIDGGLGADIMYGVGGNDTYIVDDAGDQVKELIAGKAGGTDLVKSSVDFTLGDNVENLILTGVANLDGTGNASNNVMTGNDGANVLDGQGGNDTMAGGKGNDIYYVDSSGDKVVETLSNAAGGNDTVISSVSFSVANLANVEDITLSGFGNINATGNAQVNWLTGNDGNNVLSGGGGDDRLYGGQAGLDVLDGGKGADTMIGSDDATTYYVDNVGDKVTENFNGGYDTVVSSISLDTGWKNVEAYYFATGADVNFWGYNASFVSGGSGDDKLGVTSNSTYDCELDGNLGNDTLTGGIGNDTLNGGKGADTMSGGAGDDLYIVDNVGDIVNEDKGAGNDRIESSISIDLLAGNVEQVYLEGKAALHATGNDLDNVIGGNDGANVLDGGQGADMMFGGQGSDIYIVDNAGDTAIEMNAGAAGGIDLVKSSVTYTLGACLENLTLTGTDKIDGTGNDLNNVITGNDSGNHLDGGAGSDTLVGGNGNDTYLVDNIGDKVVEAAGGGLDEVYSTVGFSLAGFANVENLVLFGAADIDATGNALNNHLDGNDGNNVLDGGKGSDTMRGYLGDDTYHVDNAGDFVFEDPGAGNDTIISTVALTSAVDNVENYIFNTNAAVHFIADTDANIIYGGSGADNIDGAGGLDALYGKGGNDTLQGGSLADLLDGGTGADLMTGGAGNDTYYVDNVGDYVSEQFLNGGTADSVHSTVSVAQLWDNVEILYFTGTAALNATGNKADNEIAGNGGANKIDGAAGDDFISGNAGNDTLTGGTGADTFYFNAYLSKGNEGHDTITDFVKGEDVLSFHVADVHADGQITLQDLLDSTTVVDHGLGKAVDVHFANGGEITFLGAGTGTGAGAVHSIDQLVADAATQIHVN